MKIQRREKSSYRSAVDTSKNNENKMKLLGPIPISLPDDNYT